MHVAFKTELSVLFLRIYIYFSITSMYVTVGDYVRVSVVVQKTDWGALQLELDSPELPNMGAGILTNFLRVEHSLE